LPSHPSLVTNGVSPQSSWYPSPNRIIFACEVTRLIDIHTLVTASPRILVLLWGVTLPYCAFAGWLFVSLADQNAPFPAGVLAGAFLLIGVTMLAGTVMVTLRYLKYDALTLTLTGEAPAVGKRLDGIVDLPAGAAAAWIGVELACVHVSHARIGANQIVTSEKDCWSEKRQFPVRRSGRRGSAVVRFDIPDSLPPSGDTPATGAPATDESARDAYIWQLRIEAGADAQFRRTLWVRVLPSASRTCHAKPQTL
jgi:hypothetical protein